MKKLFKKILSLLDLSDFQGNIRTNKRRVCVHSYREEQPRRSNGGINQMATKKKATKKKAAKKKTTKKKAAKK